jgi:hypothetical protein
MYCLLSACYAESASLLLLHLSHTAVIVYQCQTGFIYLRYDKLAVAHWVVVSAMPVEL